MKRFLKILCFAMLLIITAVTFAACSTGSQTDPGSFGPRAQFVTEIRN